MAALPDRSFDSIDDAFDFLYRFRRSGVKLGLGNMERLTRAVGNPQDAFKVIHLAGTNGKGSVAAMLEAVLLEDDCRVGCFTSPHLIRFNERIRVGGCPIEDDALLEQINDLLPVLERLSQDGVEPTFFEVCTVLAFQWFRQCGVDWVILETGLGGRLDSTNIVRSKISVITSIGYDHREFLGDTLEEIAFEKAGIIKEGQPVVVGPLDAGSLGVIREKARQSNARLIGVKAPPVGRVELSTLRREIEMEGRQFLIGLPGRVQGINAALTLQVIRELASLGREVAESSLVAGLSKVVWPARFQRINTRPETILDGAHNAPAWANVRDTWMEIYGKAPDVLVLGSLRNKWDEEVAKAVMDLAGNSTRLWLVPVPNEPSVGPDDFINFTSRTPDRVLSGISDVCQALQQEPEDRRILISGSLYLAGAVLSYQQQKPGHAHLNG